MGGNGNVSDVDAGNGAHGSPPNTAIVAHAVQSDSVPNDTPMQFCKTDVQGHVQVGRPHRADQSWSVAPAVQAGSGPNHNPMQSSTTIATDVVCGVGAQGGPPTDGTMDSAAHRGPGPKDIPCEQLPRPPEKGPAENTGDAEIDGPLESSCAQEGHAMEDIGQDTLPRPPEDRAETKANGEAIDMNVVGAANHELTCAQEGQALEVIGQDTLPCPPEALAEAEAKIWTAWQALLPAGHYLLDNTEELADLMKSINAPRGAPKT